MARTDRDHETFYRNLYARDPRPTETAAVRVFVLIFSFSIFSDRRSLKIENENNSMKT